MNRGVLLFLAIASLVTGGAGLVLGSMYIERLRTTPGSASEPDPEYRRVPADAGSKWMTGFTLTDRSGKQVQWKDLQGKVTVTSFFFSSCPATCLQQNQKVREIQQAYQGKDVVFLSITCDPEIDTPDRLREYADRLQADKAQWLFLTGDLPYIRRVAGELFGVMLDKHVHTDHLIASDKWGNVRGRYNWKQLDEVTKLKQQVDQLLVETEEPAELIEEKQKQAAALEAAVGQASSLPENDSPPAVESKAE
jgi:cytochrome oxidase Cu insertion factor (SCO1/SenC/PrrC family)